MYLGYVHVLQIWTGPSKFSAVGTVELYEIYFHVGILILRV